MRRRQRLLVGALVAAVVVLRVVLVLAVHAHEPERAVTHDTPGYIDPALSLMQEGTFSRSPDSATPEFLRTPGYPLFVALGYAVSGESNAVVLAVQAAASGLTVLLAVLLARRLSGSTAVGLAAGGFLAIDPVQAVLAGLLQPETLATVLTTLAAFVGVRFVQSGFSPALGVLYGAALAATTFVHPISYYFPLVAIAVFLVIALRRRATRTRVLRGAIAFVIPCVVLLGAWNVRNQMEVGSWRFSAIEAVNLYWYRAAEVHARREGVGFEEARVELTEELNRDAPDVDSRNYSGGQLPRSWSDRQGEYYDRAHRSGRELLLSEPLLTARQFASGVYSQVVQSGWRRSFSFVGVERMPGGLAALGLFFVWSSLGLAVVGVIVSLRGPASARPAHVLTIALAAYAIIVAAGAEAAAGWRLRSPTWPIVAVYAAIGARRTIQVVRRSLPGRLVE